MDGQKIFKQSFQMEKEQLERLGGALRKAREAKGVKLREVAKIAGVSSQAVGQWERGENGPSMGKLIAVGKFLEIDVTPPWAGP
jgi:transcriptional regulator with XRE-family HTH domain